MATQDEINRIFAKVILADNTREGALTEEERQVLRTLR